jgi:hypothetical protein
MLNSDDIKRTKDLIMGKVDIELSSFAFKIFLQQLRVQQRLGQYDSDIDKLVKKVDTFLENNKNLPTLWSDFEKIYGRKMHGHVV